MPSSPPPITTAGARAGGRGSRSATSASVRNVVHAGEVAARQRQADRLGARRQHAAGRTARLSPSRSTTLRAGGIERDAPAARSRSAMPCSAYQARGRICDVAGADLAGQQRGQQHAVVGRLRLGADHRDVEPAGRQPPAAPPAASGPPCRCRPPPAARAAAPGPWLTPRPAGPAPCGGRRGTRARAARQPGCRSGRRPARGACAAAAAAPPAPRRCAPPARWSS